MPPPLGFYIRARSSPNQSKVCLGNDRHANPKGRTPSHHLYAVWSRSFLSQSQESSPVFAARTQSHTTIYRLYLESFRKRNYYSRNLRRVGHGPTEERSYRPRRA